MKKYGFRYSIHANLLKYNISDVIVGVEDKTAASMSEIRGNMTGSGTEIVIYGNREDIYEFKAVVRGAKKMSETLQESWAMITWLWSEDCLHCLGKITENVFSSL